MDKPGFFRSLMGSLHCFLFQTKYFLLAYSLGAFYLIVERYRKYTGKAKILTNSELPFRRDHVAVITGGTSGIGLKVVEKLLTLGMHVVVGAPLTEEECRNFKNTFESKRLNCKVQIWPLHLTSMQSVKKFAQMFLESGKPLHILINNAGVMYVPYNKTQDGFEEHFQVNYLSHCLLTKLLLPKLKETGTDAFHTRIVNVSSSTHFVGSINFEDIQSERYYSKYFGYLQSKLAIVLHTYSLQRELTESNAHVTVNCLHPGVVYTNLYKHVWWAKYLGAYVFKKPEEGAETVVYAAVAPALEGVGGKYLEESQIYSSSKLSHNRALQNNLLRFTENMLQKWKD